MNRPINVSRNLSLQTWQHALTTTSSLCVTRILSFDRTRKFDTHGSVKELSQAREVSTMTAIRRTCNTWAKPWIIEQCIGAFNCKWLSRWDNLAMRQTSPQKMWEPDILSVCYMNDIRPTHMLSENCVTPSVTIVQVRWTTCTHNDCFIVQ